jgi:hypothetical protein
MLSLLVFRKWSPDLGLRWCDGRENKHAAGFFGKRIVARKTGHPKPHSLVTSALRCHACPWRSAPRATMPGATSKAGRRPSMPRRRTPYPKHTVTAMRVSATGACAITADSDTVDSPFRTRILPKARICIRSLQLSRKRTPPMSGYWDAQSAGVAQGGAEDSGAGGRSPGDLQGSEDGGSGG